MRNSIELDHLLENTVAAALGLAKPHPGTPRKLKLSRSRPARRAHRIHVAARRTPARKAA